MTHLRSFVLAAIENESAPLWWPGLAVALARARSSRLPFAPEKYSTSAFLDGKLIPEKLLTSPLAAAHDRLGLTLEVLAPTLAERFADRNLVLADANDVTDGVCNAIADATALICNLPSLAESIRALARSVHILKSEGPGYDVSFSDPSIPFSIFLSVPDAPDRNLRVAEAIVHESMHLQLTLVEDVAPLVGSDQATHYSPWKQQTRPLSGIVHATYVFSVISQWLDYLAIECPELSPKIVRRRSQIAEEIAELDVSGIEEGLTPLGQRLIRRLFESHR